MRAERVSIRTRDVAARLVGFLGDELAGGVGDEESTEAQPILDDAHRLVLGALVNQPGPVTELTLSHPISDADVVTKVQVVPPEKLSGSDAHDAASHPLTGMGHCPDGLDAKRRCVRRSRPIDSR